MSIVNPPLKMTYSQLQEYLTDKKDVSQLLLYVYKNINDSKVNYRYLTIKDSLWQWEFEIDCQDNPWDPMYTRFEDCPETEEDEGIWEEYINFKNSFFTIKLEGRDENYEINIHRNPDLPNENGDQIRRFGVIYKEHEPFIPQTIQILGITYLLTDIKEAIKNINSI